MGKISITEEMHLEKEWFEQAREQTIETLPAFIDHIMKDYGHDYGTICHAVSACALAAAWAANNHPSAGITGFQASFVMWDFVRQWTYHGNKCGLKIVNYDDMVYPQYEDKFHKTISRSTWEAIQKQAKENLDDAGAVHPDVLAHLESIVAGVVPFGYSVVDD